MPSAVPERETIRVTPLSHQVWPGIVVLGLLVWLVLTPRPQGVDPVDKVVMWCYPVLAALFVVWRLATPYLMLGRTYLRVRGPRGLKWITWKKLVLFGRKLPDEGYDDGALIRLADIASYEVKGYSVVLTWWHRARTERISLRGVRSRDRARFLAYLEEKVGRGAEPKGARE